MTSKSKKVITIVAICVAILVLCISYFVGIYNALVSMDEAVSSSWAQVENQYQRRLDLIPNLVSTVQGYAKHESSVLEEVTNARAKCGGSVEVGDEILSDPEAFARYQEAQNAVSSSLQRLLAVVENYPDLKANENFLALQDQLEGTENRIAVERKRFNDAVQNYNKAIRVFPKNIVAKNHGFEKKAYFESTEQAKTAPKVEF